MAIPASVGLYVNWGNGSYSSPTYTAATPDKPNGQTWTKTGTGFSLAVDNDSPWNGQTCVFVTNLYNDTISTTVTSSEVATSGRFLLEMQDGTFGRTQFYINATDANNGQIAVFNEGGGGTLRVQMGWNGNSKTAYVDLGTYPTGAFCLEVIYDPQNATESLRLRARTWTLGGSPGSFNNTGSTTGTSVAMDQPTLVQFGENTDGQLGRVIISNDISEDLSNVTEDSGSTVLPGRGTAIYAGLAPLVNPQYSRPSADTGTVGSWTYVGAASYYGAINESARSDSEYIQSGANPSSDAIIIKLGTVTDPGTDVGLHIQWTAGATGSAGSVTGSVRQGNSPGTEIAAWTHSSLPVGSYTLFDDPLTSAQVANITDFSDLYLKLVAS